MLSCMGDSMAILYSQGMSQVCCILWKNQEPLLVFELLLPLHSQCLGIGNVFRVRQALWGDLGSPGIPGTVSGHQVCAQGKRNWCPHADEHVLFFFLIFKKNIYLAASGLGCCMGELHCNTRELRCIMWDLLLQRMNSHSLVESAPQHVGS